MLVPKIESIVFHQNHNISSRRILGQSDCGIVSNVKISGIAGGRGVGAVDEREADF